MEEITTTLDLRLTNFGFTRTLRRTVFVIVNVLAITSFFIFQREYLWTTITLGLIFVIVTTFLFWKSLRMVTTTLVLNSLYKNVHDISLGLLIVLAGFGLVMALVHEVKLFSLARYTDELGVKKFIYPLFVIVQQYIYMWAPNIVFAQSKKIIRFMFSTLFFGLAHAYYFEPQLVFFSAVAVGAPCAYLCTYKNNYLAAIVVHLLAGSAGLYLKFV
jgi:hypothetical protein